MSTRIDMDIKDRDFCKNQKKLLFLGLSFIEVKKAIIESLDIESFD